jgi:hypothetical protein
MSSSRTQLLAALAMVSSAVLLGSIVSAGPAGAVEVSVAAPSDPGVIRRAMTAAGADESAIRSVIDELATGRTLDAARPDSVPSAVERHELPRGGSETIETFADGSQRSTSEFPVTTTDDRSGRAVTTFTTIQCDALFCTLLLSRAQTKTMASGGNAAKALLTAACGPAAWACAIAIGIVVDQANRAVRAGKCVGVRRPNTVTLATWPVTEPCRQ